MVSTRPKLDFLFDISAAADQTVYICHNCCDTNSPSGELCLCIASSDKDKGKILHGNVSCVKKYRAVHSDFYIFGSEESRDLLKRILDSPLWDINLCDMKLYNPLSYLKKEGIGSKEPCKKNIENEYKLECCYIRRGSDDL